MDLSFIQEQLDTKGYCIIPNILNKDEDNIDNDYKNIKNVYYYLSNYIYKDLLDNIILHFLIENEYYNNYFDLVKY